MRFLNDVDGGAVGRRRGGDVAQGERRFFAVWLLVGPAAVALIIQTNQNTWTFRLSGTYTV